MARRILILGIPAIAAYGIYTTNRLLAEYPIRAVSTYHQSPEIIPTLRQAKDFGRVEVIYARVPLKADCTSVGQKETEPLDRLLKAFWSTWTVRLEAFLAPILISPSPPAELVGTDRRAQPHQEQLAFARSLFPIYRYYPTSVVFQWRFTPDIGGIQELAAVEKQDEGVVEISYACAQYGISDTGSEAGWGDRVMGAFHRIYMRFLLDQARWKMGRDAC